MAIALYKSLGKGQVELVGDSLVFGVDNNQNKVWCSPAPSYFGRLPIDQKAAQEFLGARLLQCPNTGTFSKATSDTFYWRAENLNEGGLAYSRFEATKLRFERCSICGYRLVTEGDPNLTASFYPERGGHSGEPHPERMYMPDSINEVIVTDARYQGTGIVAGPNQGTLGILHSSLLINHPTIIASVEQSVKENFPDAEILYTKDRCMIFQDGPTGYE